MCGVEFKFFLKKKEIEIVRKWIFVFFFENGKN